MRRSRHRVQLEVLVVACALALLLNGVLAIFGSTPLLNGIAAAFAGGVAIGAHRTARRLP